MGGQGYTGEAVGYFQLAEARGGIEFKYGNAGGDLWELSRGHGDCRKHTTPRRAKASCEGWGDGWPADYAEAIDDPTLPHAARHLG
jgi:hypothetical protein